MGHRTMFVGVILTLAASPMAGCRGPGESTRITASDTRALVASIERDLLSSEWLAERGADSTPIFVTVKGVENLSADIISEGERWYQIKAVCDSLSGSELARQKRISFVVPANQGGGAATPPPPSDVVTHLLHAQILSTRRRQDQTRSDYYYWSYRITDLRSGEQVWAGKFEVERTATGDAWN